MFCESSEVLTGWDAFEKALIYQRYSIRDPKTGERLEKTFEDVIDRISNYLSGISFPGDFKILQKGLDLARNRSLTFGTPALMNLGNPYARRLGYYSCFPLGDIPDSTKDILKYVDTCSSVFQYAGGVGLGFSKLRPRNSFVDGGQGASSGPVGFIPLYCGVAESISQGGKRRGAMLGQLDWDHADIMDFVKLKRDRRDLYSINLSVNAFGGFWNNKELIREIATSMWTSGDPGLLFIENMSNSPYPSHLKPQVKYVNPCAEYTSIAFSACNLLSLNATHCMSIDEFFELGYYAAHLGNAILWITMTRNGEGLPKEAHYHFERFFEVLQAIRPVGIGATGLSEHLLRHGISYTNTDYLKDVYSAITRGTLVASSEWREATKMEAEWDPGYKERHLDMIGWDDKIPSKFFNTTTMCQAPGGSVSQLLRTLSTGIEPLSSTSIERQFLNSDNEFTKVRLTSLFADKICEDDLTSISWEDQLKVVAAIQEVMHTSASKTINIPHETSVEEIEEIIYQARHLGIKGLTVFRKGCALDSIISDKLDNKSNGDLEDVREGKTYKFKGAIGSNLYVTINRNDMNEVKETFVEIGKSGSEINCLCAGISRLASIALRLGASPAIITRSLGGLESGNFFVNSKCGRAASICDAIARAVSAEQTEEMSSDYVDGVFDLCPNCSHYTLERSGNCKTCSRCGHSTC